MPISTRLGSVIWLTITNLLVPFKLNGLIVEAPFQIDQIGASAAARRLDVNRDLRHRLKLRNDSDVTFIHIPATRNRTKRRLPFR